MRSKLWCCWLSVALVAAGGVMLGPVGARGQAAGQAAVAFDPPVAAQKVPPKSDDDPIGEIRCTYYPDLMVRETNTDTPDPAAATLLPLAAGASRPACDGGHRPHELALPTEGFTLLGRKSGFLLFSATDPNGAVPFVVLDAGNGRAIFSDGTAADRGFQTVTVEHDRLRLRYTRGLNASCSIMQDAAGCWSKLLTDGQVPRAMAAAGPSRDACAASYAAERAPADDPSIVTYDMEMTVDAAGRVEVLSRGLVGCAPVP